MIIAFSGKMGSGKDTWGNEFSKMYNNSIKYSFAEPLKEELNNLIKDFVQKTDNEILSKKYNVSISEIEKAYSIIYKKLNSNLKIENRSPETRALLQYWGTDVRRNQDENYWTNIAKERILNYIEKNKNVYITDLRFLNEFNLIKELKGKVFLLEVSKEEKEKRLLKRDNYIPKEELNKHSSEKELHFIKNDKYTHVINTNNLSLKDIKEVLKKLI